MLTAVFTYSSEHSIHCLQDLHPNDNNDIDETTFYEERILPSISEGELRFQNGEVNGDSSDSPRIAPL